MNKEWSELNRTMQLQLGKKDTFAQGIGTLMLLREKLMEQILLFQKELSAEAFCAMPYPHADGYHSKTIAYSLWHIFRIEDIVVNTLIANREQVFFAQEYQKRIGSPIITTGNELTGEEIAAFSKALNIDELYSYIADVNDASADMIHALSFEAMRIKISAEQKQELLSLHVVSDAEASIWLIDYWCSKDIRGLIKMPLSRHWIMHIEASLRIRDRLSVFGNK